VQRGHDFALFFRRSFITKNATESNDMPYSFCRSYPISVFWHNPFFGKIVCFCALVLMLLFLLDQTSQCRSTFVNRPFFMKKTSGYLLLYSILLAPRKGAPSHCDCLPLVRIFSNEWKLTGNILLLVTSIEGLYIFLLEDGRLSKTQFLGIILMSCKQSKK
jgi:hypothetical protein